MTLLTGHLAVRTRQRKAAGRVIEHRAGILEGRLRRMTTNAIGSERSFVRVGMTGAARRSSVEERPCLVAGRALGGDGRMQSIERESGLTRVIEGRGVDMTKFAVNTRVFDVTRHAFLDGPVNALSRGHAFGDRLVAAETFLGRDLATYLVALLALRRAFERGVRSRQTAGRQERT